MNRKSIFMAVVFMAGVFHVAVSAQLKDFVEDAYYLCNGEHVYARCDPDNKTDSGICVASYPDRPKPRGATITQSTRRGELLKMLSTCTPPSAAEIEDINKGNQMTADYQKQAVEQQREYQRQMQAKANSGGVDDGTLAMRRCVASGRNPAQCTAEIFSSGLQQWAGGPGNQVGAAYGAALPPGLRMSGQYGNGHFWLTFTEKSALVGCDAAGYQTDYVVSIRNGQIVITTMPRPELQKLGTNSLSLVVAPDGRIVLATEADAIGTTRIAEQDLPATEKKYLSGYELNQYHSETIHKDAGGYYIEQQTATKSALYKTSVSRCAPGFVPPTGSVGPTYATQGLSNLMGGQTMAAMFGGAPWQNRPPQDKAWPGPGMRLTGTYQGNGGLSLEFHEDSVIVSCGPALSARNYTLVQSGPQPSIRIENGEQPILLSMTPDMNISGTGAIRLAGNMFVGDRPGASAGSMFAPVTGTCSIGTLFARR